MKTWTDITTTALMGTERTPMKPITGDVDDPLTSALARATSSGDPETALLSAAGLITVYRKVGQIPGVDGVELPTPAPADVLPECSEKAAHVVGVLLAGGANYGEIVVEAVRLLTRSGHRLPHALLPDILAWAGRNKSADVDILPVIDRRGVWLAGQNPEWSFAALPLVDAASIDAAMWTELPSAARRAILVEVGKRDPVEGRRLLMLTWASDSSEERSVQLIPMHEWVTDEDEDFLEMCLDDAGRVRAKAAELLTKLPNSRFVARMTSRADALIKVSYQFGKGHTLDVTLPVDLDASMKRDGMNGGTPADRANQGGQGLRAKWLTQIVSAVPPGHWSARFEMTPEEVVGLVEKSEWAETLLRAMSTAASTHPDQTWTLALTKAMTKRPIAQTAISELAPAIQRLPPEKLEAIILYLLDRTPIGAPSVMRGLLGLYPGEWPSTLARPILGKIGQTLTDFSDHQTLSMATALLRETASHADPALVDDFAALVEHAQSLTTTHWHRQMEQALDIVRLRKELHDAIINA